MGLRHLIGISPKKNYLSALWGLRQANKHTGNDPKWQLFGRYNAFFGLVSSVLGLAITLANVTPSAPNSHQVMTILSLSYLVPY